MELQEFVKLVKNNSQHRYLYHFTDERNYPLLKSHGLLSKAEMRRQEIWPVAPSGNQWSHEADDRKGISEYVSICMTTSHPMKYAAVEDGRIETPRHLCIEPDVLLADGVMFTIDIANKSGVNLVPIQEALNLIDVEVLYSRTDWKDADVQKRLKATEKYEILVPHHVPLSLIPKAF